MESEFESKNAITVVEVTGVPLGATIPQPAP